MSSSHRHQEAHEKFNARDWDGLKGMVSTELAYEDRPRSISSKGPDEFIDWLNGWTTTFSDAAVVGAEYIDAGEWSIARFTGRGINDGELGGMPATGRTMSMPYCEILHWTDGKMDRGEIYYDQVTMMTQLGVMEEPSA